MKFKYLSLPSTSIRARLRSAYSQGESELGVRIASDIRCWGRGLPQEWRGPRQEAPGLLKTGAEKTRGDMHNHNVGVLVVSQGRGEGQLSGTLFLPRRDRYLLRRRPFCAGEGVWRGCSTDPRPRDSAHYNKLSPLWRPSQHGWLFVRIITGPSFCYQIFQREKAETYSRTHSSTLCSLVS